MTQVIIGTVAIRSVNSLIDPNPYEKLEQACTMFQSGAETNSRALRALVSHIHILLTRSFVNVGIENTR